LSRGLVTFVLTGSTDKGAGYRKIDQFFVGDPLIRFSVCAHKIDVRVLLETGGNMTGTGGDVTLLLAQVRSGDSTAANRLIPLIYSELRRIASANLQRERPGHTLQPTALVNEAYVRLAGEQTTEWRNRVHFFAFAAQTMRRVLVDHARRRRAQKRSGDYAANLEFDEDLLIVPEKLEEVLAVDEALDQLAGFDPRQSRVLELRFFAGLNTEEVAEVMGLSAVTVRRELRSAKAWLRGRLTTKAA
jgi:RNA polymerase sigma-70 factor (ECF subfamily)